MSNTTYQIEESTPFSESLIWQLNRDFYQEEGIGAWRENAVPSHLTSNSMVGKTYAELIFGFLRDLARKGQTQENVYIIELGAGHGRLAFHILKHLVRLTDKEGINLPPYTYVLSDIVEDNLNFFKEHPQFQSYFEQGLLDVTYFDAVGGDKMELRYANKTIKTQTLKQPLVAIGNYFFDSLPTDLFHYENTKISSCSISLSSTENPEGMKATRLLEHLETSFQDKLLTSPFYQEANLNAIIEDYRLQVFDTYLFFPHKGLQCIQNLQNLSKQGLLLISMDKGYHQIHDLESAKKPEIITHGSFSVWVNYHALGAYCEKSGGKVLFPAFSTFHLELGCFFFTPEVNSFTETEAAYQRFVNDFGPDDFNGLKRLTYKQMGHMSLTELIGMLRLSAYDSTFFKNLLPRIRQEATRITFNERMRLAQTLRQTWDMYFSLNESFDMAYEIGGVFYDLGFFEEALGYFEASIKRTGAEADVIYNQALCYYQLRKDDLFTKTLVEGKKAFPDYERFAQLDKLDLGAA